MSTPVRNPILSKLPARPADRAQTFDPFGLCQGTGCKRLAEGVVRGPGGKGLGLYCHRCGAARVLKASMAREAITEKVRSDVQD